MQAGGRAPAGFRRSGSFGAAGPTSPSHHPRLIPIRRIRTNALPLLRPPSADRTPGPTAGGALRSLDMSERRRTGLSGRRITFSTGLFETGSVGWGSGRKRAGLGKGGLDRLDIGG